MNKLLFFFVLIFASGLNANSQTAGNFPHGGIDMLKTYAEGFEPSYIDGADTLLIAHIPPLPDTLESFLRASIKTKSHEVDKYAFLVVMKLANEFRRRSGADHDFCNYEGNGIVDVVFEAMGKNHTDESCFITRTYEIYLWLLQHKEIYKDYKPLIHEMRVMKTYQKNKKL